MMRYKLLGRSGLRVSELCLGTMTFGSDWGWGADRAESEKMFSAFVEQGGNFIDTAGNYTGGTSEKYVGEMIKSDRHRYVLATKYTLSSNPTDPNACGNHLKNMRQSIEASLRRLNTDYIDLLWVHARDEFTPFEETMRGLHDFVRSGKVNYIGISDAPAWWIAKANVYAELHGWTRFIAMQIQYSLVERTPERELLPLAADDNMTVTPWGILGSGILTGKYRSMQDRPMGTRLAGEWGRTFLTERNFQIANVVEKVAKECGQTPSQVAINWLRQQQTNQGVQILPILGARTFNQLQDNMTALKHTLTEEQCRRLDEASAISLGFPHDFLLGARNFIYGETYEQIDQYQRSR